MPNAIELRRTALYMPSANARALEKAQGLATDVLIFDLEDAVSPANKVQARQILSDALHKYHYGLREKVVRINAVDSPWGIDDIKFLHTVEIDAVLIPKAESVEQINEVLALLDQPVSIWLMVETPTAVLNIETLADHEAVDVLVMGTNDLAKELQVQQSSSRLEFMHAFGHCIMAAKANGCDILDGVFNALDDISGLEQVCKQGRQLGFNGKTVIHPKQLSIANSTFAPSVSEADDARMIVDAWEANNDSSGVLVVNGRLVEALHVEQAKRTLAMLESIAKTQV